MADGAPVPDLQRRDDDVLGLATAAAPGLDLGAATVVAGEFHDVVLVPGVAVVKVARGAAARHLPRRAALLRRLDGLDLPFAVPRPLGDVVTVGDRAAVALAWVTGRPAADGALAPGDVTALLDALTGVPLDAVTDLLDEPHAYAGRSRWPELMAEAAGLLPPSVRDAARRRLDAALALPSVPPSLVHGDPAGANVLLGDAGGVAEAAHRAARWIERQEAGVPVADVR